MEPIIDKRRKRIANKKVLNGLPTPKPEWVEAFLILLLHNKAMLQEKISGVPGAKAQLTVSVKSLENFEKLKKDNKTLISYDPDNDLITIRAPETKLPECIIAPNNKIIVN